jgi:hypothetical protein
MPAPVRIAASPRLQRVLAALADGAPHSTRDIADAARVVAVDTAVRELRQAPNHLQIHGWRQRHIHYYQLAPVSRLEVLVRQAAELAGA